MHLALITPLAALLALAPLGSASSPSDLVARVKAYETAANRHDWPAVRSLIAEGAVIDLGEDLSLVGRDSARSLHDWERAMGTVMHYTDCRANGSAVTCQATEQNDFLRLAGLDSIRYSASTITFDESGRVVRMNAVLSEESAEAVTRYMLSFLAWAREAEPARVDAFLKPDGSFLFGFDSAMTFKRLVGLYALTRRGVSRAL